MITATIPHLTPSNPAVQGLYNATPVAAKATEAIAEPEAKAFYFVTTAAAVTMGLLTLYSIVSMVFFFVVVYQTWLPAVS